MSIETRWYMRVVHFFFKPNTAIEYGLAKYGAWICPCADCKALVGEKQ